MKGQLEEAWKNKDYLSDVFVENDNQKIIIDKH